MKNSTPFICSEMLFTANGTIPFFPNLLLRLFRREPLENGERRYFYGKKRQYVNEKMQAALREKQQGTLVDASQQTVEQYLQRWLEYSAKDHVRPRTYERYEQYVRLHIIPMLGKTRFCSVSR